MNAVSLDWDAFELNFDSDDACLMIDAMFREEHGPLLLQPVPNWGFPVDRPELFDESSDDESEVEVSRLHVFLFWSSHALFSPRRRSLPANQKCFAPTVGAILSLPGRGVLPEEGRIDFG